MDKDVIVYAPKTSLKTIGQIRLELIDKVGKSHLGFMLLQQELITLEDYMKWEISRN